MPEHMGSSMHVYDEAVAGHYAAYRPPLHAPILDNAVGNGRFVSGLDIGCGTGQSTAALALRTETVIGIDTSQSMIASVFRKRNWVLK